MAKRKFSDFGLSSIYTSVQDFIDKAPETMKTAAYSAMRERSVGLGVMGLHSFFNL